VHLRSGNLNFYQFQEGVPSNPIVSGVPSPELEKNTLKNYEFIFSRFQETYGERQIDSRTTDEVLSFLTGLSTAAKPATKHHRYSCLKAFFNFLKNSVDPGIQNPCDTAMLRKMFRERLPQQWKIVLNEVNTAFRQSPPIAPSRSMDECAFVGFTGPEW
jgi:site-specific recombinase XerD